MERIVYSDGFLPEPGAGTTFDHYPEEEEKRTRQSDRDAADINLTIKKYNLQPLDMPVGWSGKVGEYADQTGYPSLQEALGVLAVAREHFDQVPPEIRAFFENDPAKMLDAWSNGENAEIFEKLGWLEKLPAESPPAVPAPGAVPTPS